MGTPITVGISGSSSVSTSQELNPVFDAGNYINFGQGILNTPESNIFDNPQTTTATATASTPLGAGSTGIGTPSAGASGGYSLAVILAAAGAVGLLVFFVVKHHPTG